jgi:NADH:ubiquinone oxidoreductase subunit 5 (subunit L)/multisubunit Na+/H+ antiporter MnhA subunit
VASWGGGFDTAWLPSWDARLAFRLDGLGALYALLATGIGVAVFAYATAYVPRHLEHEGRPQVEGRRFHALILSRTSLVIQFIKLYYGLDLDEPSLARAAGLDRCSLPALARS